MRGTKRKLSADAVKRQYVWVVSEGECCEGHSPIAVFDSRRAFRRAYEKRWKDTYGTLHPTVKDVWMSRSGDELWLERFEVAQESAFQYIER